MTLNARVQRLDFWDLKFLGLTGVIFGILLSKIRLDLLDISSWWWTALAILLALRPLYHYWIKGVVHK